jgi:hypothetical protein
VPLCRIQVWQQLENVLPVQAIANRPYDEIAYLQGGVAALAAELRGGVKCTDAGEAQGLGD